MQPKIERVDDTTIEIKVKKSIFSTVVITPTVQAIDVLNHNVEKHGDIKGQTIKVPNGYKEVTLHIKLVSVK